MTFKAYLTHQCEATQKQINKCQLQKGCPVRACPVLMAVSTPLQIHQRFKFRKHAEQYLEKKIAIEQQIAFSNPIDMLYKPEQRNRSQQSRLRP